MSTSARKIAPARGGLGHRPTPTELAAAKLLLEPWQWLTAPRFFGVESVPADRPALIVGNHTLMGVLDVPLLVLGLYERRGIILRSLGDHLHYRVPIWRDLLTRFGAVEGTPANCRALMRAREPILVFPGGGREVFKHRGERYRLIWKQRVGFVRLAVEHHYPIVPLAAVGAEECYDILIDGPDLLHSPVGPVLEQLAPRPDEIPPIVLGFGPLPRPQRFYFRFGHPVETAPYAGQQRDDAVCFALRERTRRAIRRGIAWLLAVRDADPQRDLAHRLLARFTAGGAAPARRRAGSTTVRRRARRRPA